MYVFNRNFASKIKQNIFKYNERASHILSRLLHDLFLTFEMQFSIQTDKYHNVNICRRSIIDDYDYI